MKKKLKIIIIIITILLGIIIIDSIQALIFNTNPIIGIETKCRKKEGIFVDNYHCSNDSNITKLKLFDSSCDNENVCNNEEYANIENDNSKEKLYQCLENELGGYLVTERDNLIHFPLTEIKNVNSEKIEYFKGTYASNHPDNMYMIIFPQNGTYESEVMNSFTEYFSNKFSIYQIFESPIIPTIYIHTENNDIDINSITDKCLAKVSSKSDKSIPTSTIKKLDSTNKIVIKSGNKIIGEINNKDKITEIIDAISQSKQYGDTFLCDGHSFDFVMYNNNKLINTFHIWHDGKRLLPTSDKGKGCYYYSTPNHIDLRKIIEEETDYVFYSILDFSDVCAEALELIYENNNNKYYLSCIKSDKVLIKFTLNNKTMKLKYALEKGYIEANRVSSDYPNILIKG